MFKCLKFRFFFFFLFEFNKTKTKRCTYANATTAKKINVLKKMETKSNQIKSIVVLNHHPKKQRDKKSLQSRGERKHRIMEKKEHEKFHLQTAQFLFALFMFQLAKAEAARVSAAHVFRCSVALPSSVYFFIIAFYLSQKHARVRNYVIGRRIRTH